jgi:hypothetical protein
VVSKGGEGELSKREKLQRFEAWMLGFWFLSCMAEDEKHV